MYTSTGRRDPYIKEIIIKLVTLIQEGANKTLFVAKLINDPFEGKKHG